MSIRSNWFVRLGRLPQPWKQYGVALAVFMVFFGVWLLMVPKVEGFMALRAVHSPALDFAMRLLTHLGDGVFALLLIGWLLWRKLKAPAAFVGLAYAFSGLVSQLLKNTVPADRPKLFFEKLGIVIYQVPGVSTHRLHSFPSGHTITAFALAAILVLCVKSKHLWWVAFCLAITVGYSRVYLGQHFPVDVFAGAIIGTLCAVGVYAACYGPLSRRFPAVGQ